MLLQWSTLIGTNPVLQERHCSEQGTLGPSSYPGSHLKGPPTHNAIAVEPSSNTQTCRETHKSHSDHRSFWPSEPGHSSRKRTATQGCDSKFHCWTARDSVPTARNSGSSDGFLFSWETANHHSTTQTRVLESASKPSGQIRKGFLMAGKWPLL